MSVLEPQKKLPMIYLPKQPQPHPLFFHANDTARELIKLWEEHGLCQIQESSSPHIWWNEIGTVLLYDRPTLEQLERHIGLTSQLILLGNPHKPARLLSKDLVNFHYWTFWGRHPRLLEETRLQPILNYHQRRIESIFLGKIENSVQKHYRPLDWKQYIEVFEMAEPNQSYKYDQTTYLNLLANSRFGLCLRGYGPKCNREIELLALGTVLIVTPDVDTQNYYHQLIEGTHYFLAKKPADIPIIISECSVKQWTKMSEACRKWYLENASPQGSFEITREIIEKSLTSIN